MEICSNCGTSKKDIVESSLVGCEKCYEEFSDFIDIAISSIQRADVHTGKIPEKFIYQEKIKECKQLLEQALDAQDLEQINKLSYQLKKLQGGGL